MATSAAKHLHFSEAELADRRTRAQAAMKARGLDALLMFRQESHFYLTGYDTFGYVYFQTIVLTADGRMVLLTRSADKRQAEYTSVVSDIRIWMDKEGANPAEDLKAILAELKLKGGKLGVEYEAYGLTARNGKRLEAALAGFATLEDASDLVTRLRLVKSPAEIAYVRRAGALCDAAWFKAIEIAKPGVFEGDILAGMHAEIFKGGGDDPANEFIIGSGTGKLGGHLMCRYFSGRRTLEKDDHLTLEFAGAYRHYHSCLFRTIRLGGQTDRQNDLYKASRDALAACEQALRPGRTVGDVFQAHAKTLDDAGLKAYRLNACGYSLGTTYAPNWMDWPMVYADNPVVIEPGQVFFLHMIIFDQDSGIPACVGRTSLVTDRGAEVLSKADLALTVK
jgi:Xaa-Pro dipeptidase